MRSPGAANGARSRRAGWWLALFLLALALRGAAAYARPPRFDGDQRLYLTLAESMHAGRGYLTEDAPQTTVHPLLPTLHVASLALFDRARSAGIVLTVLIGALLPLVAGRTISLMIGFRPGWLAGLFLALEPYYVVRSAYLEPDLLAALLCFWIASLLWRGAWEAAGAVLGLAYLNRPEMFLLFPVVVALARIRGASWPRLAGCAATFVALAAVFVLYVHAETGRWALSGKDRWQYQLGVHQWRSGNQPLDPSEIPRLQREVPSPLAHLRDDPGEFGLGYLYRWTLLLRSLARQLGWVLVPLLVYGAIRIREAAPAALPLLLLPLFLLPVLALVGTFVRHSYVAGNALVAVSGVGAAYAWQRWRGRFTPAARRP